MKVKTYLVLILVIVIKLYGDEHPTRKVRKISSKSKIISVEDMIMVRADGLKEQIPNFLDIKKEYFAYSGSRFYGAIENRGGGFPVSGKLGTEYYSYMLIIANKGNEGTIWAMTYISVPLVGFKPGLYKIKGRGKGDLERIGNIEYQIDAKHNRIIMSCEISVLLGDKEFRAWYGKDSHAIGFATMINRTKVMPYKTEAIDTTYPGTKIVLMNN